VKPGNPHVTPDDAHRFFGTSFLPQPTTDNEVTRYRSSTRGRTSRDVTSRPPYAEHELRPFGEEFVSAWREFRAVPSTDMRERLTETIRAMAIMTGLL